MATLAERAEKALREAGVTTLADAVRLLPMWAHYSGLTRRDVRTVFKAFPR